MGDPVEGSMWASFAKLGVLAGAISVAALQIVAGLCLGPLELMWAAWFLLFEIPVAMIIGAVAGLAVGVVAENLGFRRFRRSAQVLSLAVLGFVAMASVMTAFGLLAPIDGVPPYPVTVTGLIGAIAFTPFGLSILDGRRIFFARSCRGLCGRFLQSI